MLSAYITLAIIGMIIILVHCVFFYLQWKKYRLNFVTIKSNSKNNKSIKEANNQIKSNFVKYLLNNKLLKVLLVIDGCFFSAILITILVLVWF